ncbi:hypothetical protein ACQUFT_00305 [Mammaliicoccus lentus]|uniref:hypothetical protein n=1 Tax=Mammaliicoccus lentus TaxID=42858 RepID=UPI000CD001E9|nr:hypothetical protein [Mammaliicoccus lentus]HBV04670.1 hypothetical protein [Staphylococcus sp.]POA03586.1 hypothetical protein CD135_10275 [Mammaliicoccus lentus]QMU10840.1 hypothetical protein H3V22_00985 [Mammaliicoccus lentus]WGZ43515.1 hypothetical protein PN942_00980 [Mammaliicoccus lentus]SUM52119.1 Uncharacterised protein [Mammaliicoccus lentus]
MKNKNNFQKIPNNGMPKWVKNTLIIISIVFFVIILMGILVAITSTSEDSDNKVESNSNNDKSEDSKIEEIDNDDDETEEESEEYKAKHKFMNTPKDEFNILNATNVKDVERNPNDFIGKPYKFEGKVIQVLEEDIYNNYRIAIDDEYSSVVLVEIVDLSNNDNRILEDDYVTVYSQFEDLTSYETVSGSEVTLPKFFSDKDMIDIQ